MKTLNMVIDELNQKLADDKENGTINSIYTIPNYVKESISCKELKEAGWRVYCRVERNTIICTAIQTDGNVLSYDYIAPISFDFAIIVIRREKVRDGKFAGRLIPSSVSLDYETVQLGRIPIIEIIDRFLEYYTTEKAKCLVEILQVQNFLLRHNITAEDIRDMYRVIEKMKEMTMPFVSTEEEQSEYVGDKMQNVAFAKSIFLEYAAKVVSFLEKNGLQANPDLKSLLAEKEFIAEGNDMVGGEQNDSSKKL